MQYSIAIIPPRYIVRKAEKMKRDLCGEIDPYPSVHSEAHFTISTFSVHEAEHDIWLKKLERFCAEASSFKVHLNSIETFPSSGCIYIAPDDLSRRRIKRFMADFHRETSCLKAIRTHEPHMTIGRGLTEIQLIRAKNYFIGLPIDLTFECNQLCIRKLDLTRRQYEVEYAYPFEGKGAARGDARQLGFWD